MNCQQPIRDLIKIRQWRTEKAQRALTKARQELNETRQALAAIDDRIRQLQHSTQMAGADYCADTSIPINQLLMAQMHLQGLREALLKTQAQRSESEASNRVAESHYQSKLTAYHQLQTQVDSLEIHHRRQQQQLLIQQVVREEELTGDQWRPRY